MSRPSHHLRRLAASALVCLSAASPLAAQSNPLRVIRTAPGNDAPPLEPIVVTFDRPVAGSLDRTVNAGAIVHVTPAVTGSFQWRNAVTLKLVPAAPLASGATYTVSVDTNFRAMDGSQLAAPYQFVFRVRGPTLVDGTPSGPHRGEADHLPPTQRFQLIYSAPVDLATLGRATTLQFPASCDGRTSISLDAVDQKRVPRRERPQLPLDEEGEDTPPDSPADSLRRVVTLVPKERLPRGCRGELVAPRDLSDLTREPERMSISTYGELHGTASCDGGGSKFCPTGPIILTFTNPVRGSELLRHVRLLPATPFTLSDTAEERTSWVLRTRLHPRTTYAAVVDSALRDVFQEKLVGNPALGVATTGFGPSVVYPYGKLLVEREAFRTLAAQHVNVDTLIVSVVPVPDSLEARMLARSSYDAEDNTVWASLAKSARTQRIPVKNPLDRAMVTGVRLPSFNAMSRHAPTLMAVRIGWKSGSDGLAEGPTALVQLTDLGVHARVGATEATVWVTGVEDGRARAGADVTLFDADGRALASGRTDATGLAHFANWPTLPPIAKKGYRATHGYVAATLGTDRGLAAVSDYDPDLAPYHFRVSGAWGEKRLQVAGAVFTERGIYRPGERVHAKVIVRDGLLGKLHAPAPGDSVRVTFKSRDASDTLRVVTAPLSAFGTTDQVVDLPADAPIGWYSIDASVRRLGEWQTISNASYRVAEYRPPEFLVEMPQDRGSHLAGDRVATRVSARYLFGAPMGHALVKWTARRTPMSTWELHIPGTDGWEIGNAADWWQDGGDDQTTEFASRQDTLDARGERAWDVKLPADTAGRAVRTSIEAVVTDVNRQVVSSRTSTIAHPASFYIAARPAGSDWIWRAGAPQSIQVKAVRPDGQQVPGVPLAGVVVRREWHQVRRERDGIAALVGEWVSDTVARCAVTTSASPVSCDFTPKLGGVYEVRFAAKDDAGRAARTSLTRWASGEGWVPWSDETQFRMDVIPDRQRYAVGDTATVLFASPFTNAEAWITVEREGVIEQRRMRITSGSTTMKLPITEAFAPNAFVSIIVTRGRSEPPGTLDDAGRPTIRVGYAEFQVTPETKRLTVTVQSDASEYRPGDNARLTVQVRDRARRGMLTEVTLWAVDEGVLSLTGYKTPDPLGLLYEPRGLGLRLTSNMTSVAPQIPEGEKGRREAGGGGGAAGADILRSRFQTTAFFLGSLRTDATGNASTTIRLPDNLTTFRVMAVAVTMGDRYGSGQSPMLVTRPLIARPALPRFVRAGDRFDAGVVVNRRDGSAANVLVSAQPGGIALTGTASQRVTLPRGRGMEVRFPFRAVSGDSARFRFDVHDGLNDDAVRVAVPIRPNGHPVARTVAGVLRDTASLDLALPAGLDLDRSSVVLHLGLTPLVAVKGMAEALEVYPYSCTEQLASGGNASLALLRAARTGLLQADTMLARARIARAMTLVLGHQRDDGGFGYWNGSDWTSPWLTSYATAFLLDARDQGITVSDRALARAADFLTRSARGTLTPAGFNPVMHWANAADFRLAERVAAADLLNRMGHPLIDVENELVRSAAQLGVEERARLSKMLLRRNEQAQARTLMTSVWNSVHLVGRRAELREGSTKRFYFDSHVRPLAYILDATLALDPGHPLIAPLATAIAVQGNASRYTWNTQDYAFAATALAELERRKPSAGGGSLTVTSGSREVLRWSASGGVAVRDTIVALRTIADASARAAHLALRGGGSSATLYWYVTVNEMTIAPPVTVLDNGIGVEREYEHPVTGRPVSEVAAGELVRVRLRIEVPDTRTFVVVEDALPAGLEAVDLSLRTAAADPGPGTDSDGDEEDGGQSWFGMWDSGWWSPFDHRELRDDRVVYSANLMWKGVYTMSYLARATTPGTFIRPPVHAEEMYDPAINGRSDGGTFVVGAPPR